MDTTKAWRKAYRNNSYFGDEDAPSFRQWAREQLKKGGKLEGARRQEKLKHILQRVA